jgi:hypothetical protein
MHWKVLFFIVTVFTIAGCNQSVEVNEEYIYGGYDDDYYRNEVYDKQHHHHEHHEEHHDHGRQKNHGHEGHEGSSHHGH